MIQNLSKELFWSQIWFLRFWHRNTGKKDKWTTQSTCRICAISKVSTRDQFHLSQHWDKILGAVSIAILRCCALCYHWSNAQPFPWIDKINIERLEREWFDRRERLWVAPEESQCCYTTLRNWKNPLKISTGFSSFTADLWKNWLCFYPKNTIMHGCILSLRAA